jgi:hypothetical protein
VTKVLFTSSSTGNHTLTILRSNPQDDIFYVPAHGFTTGDPVEIAGSDVPAGLTALRYYVGSVTVNSFTLHVLRIDALASINGLTINRAEFSDTGTGNMTFTLQNVQIIGNINTSSKNPNNYSLLSTTNVDASNIISGIINTSRLGVGTANTDTFLRGDNTFQTVITSARILENSPISITGNFTTDSTTNFFFGDVAFDVVRANELLGDVNFTNVGVAAFSKGQFEVNAQGQVSVKAGRIDALSLGGLQAAFFLDPSNLTSPVPVNRGGTGLNSIPTGSIVYGSTSVAAANLAIGTANTVMTSDGTAPQWSNSLTLSGNLIVNGDTTIGNATGDALTIVAGTATVNNSLLFARDDTANNSVRYPISVRHSTSGVPAVGIGTGIEFITETTGNNFEIGTIFESVSTDVTAASEDFDAVIRVMINGATATQVLRVNGSTLQLGANNTNTTITTQGLSDLTLNTNNGTNSGFITIADGTSANITIDPSGTGKTLINSDAIVDGTLSITGGISLGNIAFSTASVAGATVLTTVDSFDKTLFRSAKYQIQIQCTAGPDAGTFEASELLLIHDGTSAFMTQWAVLTTGANSLATFTVDISGNDVRLRATPRASDTINIQANTVILQSV